MVATVNISVVEGREYLVTAPANVEVRYNGEVVTSTFIAVASVNQVLVVSVSTVTGSISITEIVRSYYEAYDQQGGTWAYPTALDKWSTQYSFRPEWMSMVANRLVTFKGGFPYVHNSATYNQFYGQGYDSTIAFVHSDAGPDIKAYESVSIEGNTPDIFHTRTEVPNIQSSDLRGAALNDQTKMAGDFRVNEGVNYAPVLRDRLSPNASGTFDQKIYTGDVMRGENALFQGVFSSPSSKKYLNFVSIGFIPSRGHNIQNKQ
jgi:hypothetical protein